jgi:ABC-type Na+ transport system ATPase subunit NatA
VLKPECLATLIQFRQELYDSLGIRQDSLFELLDAALTALQRSTLVRLSLAAVFRRLWSSTRDALADGSVDATLARVFLKDPGVVVLDDASSRLHSHTERLLERAITRLLEGRTGVVIAHRLATLQRVDCIMILEDGRVAELGRRSDLAADSTSRFAWLLRVGLAEVLA